MAMNIALVGCGGMGWVDIMYCTDENIVALCDVDEQRAAQTFAEFPAVPKYKDFRKMLDKERDIDAVIVSTPDHMHATAAVHAMELGKHVYVQKSLTHTVAAR